MTLRESLLRELTAEIFGLTDSLAWRAAGRRMYGVSKLFPSCHVVLKVLQKRDSTANDPFA